LRRLVKLDLLAGARKVTDWIISGDTNPVASLGSSVKSGLEVLSRFSTFLIGSAEGMFSGRVPPISSIAERTFFPTIS
jgi:hypothetical protein